MEFLFRIYLFSRFALGIEFAGVRIELIEDGLIFRFSGVGGAKFTIGEKEQTLLTQQLDDTINPGLNISKWRLGDGHAFGTIIKPELEFRARAAAISHDIFILCTQLQQLRVLTGGEPALKRDTIDIELATSGIECEPYGRGMNRAGINADIDFPVARDFERVNDMSFLIEIREDSTCRARIPATIEHIELPCRECPPGTFVLITRERRVLKRIELDEIDIGITTQEWDIDTVLEPVDVIDSGGAEQPAMSEREPAEDSIISLFREFW